MHNPLASNCIIVLIQCYIFQPLILFKEPHMPARAKTSPSPDTSQQDALIDALLAMKTRDDMRAFLDDLCTPGEIAALQERWRIVELLSSGDLSYRDINAMTGASTTTIGRVARFLLQERHRGYQIALTRLKK